MSTSLFDPVPPTWPRSGKRRSPKTRGPNSRSNRSGSTCADQQTPCYVYLLVHAHEARFKIGVAANTRLRASQLPEANSINFSGSFEALFPSRKRAHQVERMLHCGLAVFHHPVKVPLGDNSNGATEWFASDALAHAVNLLRFAPRGREHATQYPLISLDSVAEGKRDDAGTESNDTRKRKPPRAATLNVETMSSIVQLISEISYRVPVTWHRTRGRRERLCVLGIKDQWELGLLRAKQRLMSEDCWWMQPDERMQPDDRVSLVTLIRYQADTPQTLELEIQDLSTIRKLPGGFQISKMWRALCGRYA